MTFWRCVILCAPLAISSCSETGTAPTAAAVNDAAGHELAPADSALGYVAIGNQEPPADVPDAYLSPTSIEVSADVGMAGANIAYAQSLVSYFGTDATSEVKLEVRNTAGTVVASNLGSSQQSSLLPWYRNVTASTTAGLSESCGAVLQATASGSVWIAYLSKSQGFNVWGTKKGSDSRPRVLPGCPPVKPDACPARAAAGASLDCDVPTPSGGGDASAPPPTDEPPPPEPETYMEPRYEPAGHWEQIWEYNASTYEYQDRWIWIEHNDARQPTTGTPLAGLRGGAGRRPSAAALAAPGELPSVLVIMTDAVPAGALAVVERHRQGPHRNVLLMPSGSVRPAVFAAAMRFLSASRAMHGETPAKNRSSELRGSVLDRHVPAESREHAAVFTARLSRARQTTLGPYGTRQAITLRLAPGHSRQ